MDQAASQSELFTPMSTTEHTPLDICDFCTGTGTTWVYLAPQFSVETPIMSVTTFEAGGWAACDTCDRAIERKDINALIRRAIQMQRLRGVESERAAIEEHFRIMFTVLLGIPTTRTTKEATSHLQGYADEPIGILADGTPIMPNEPIETIWHVETASRHDQQQN